MLAGVGSLALLAGGGESAGAAGAVAGTVAGSLAGAVVAALPPPWTAGSVPRPKAACASGGSSLQTLFVREVSALKAADQAGARNTSSANARTWGTKFLFLFTKSNMKATTTTAWLAVLSKASGTFAAFWQSKRSCLKTTEPSFSIFTGLSMERTLSTHEFSTSTIAAISSGEDSHVSDSWLGALLGRPTSFTVGFSATFAISGSGFDTFCGGELAGTGFFTAGFFAGASPIESLTSSGKLSSSGKSSGVAKKAAFHSLEPASFRRHSTAWLL
mmetsp:Transcript_45478/g.120646  ORF Transcript_45478/g.120646 Transcript_45478/m.120646 type:complete len:273 (-) Transcript_45478:167-985(-)